MTRPWFPWVVIGVTVTLGVTLAFGLILGLRRESYRKWRPLGRAVFLATAGFFALIGAWLWIALWSQRHPLLGAGQFVLCAVIFWQQVIAPWRASG